MHQIKSIPDTEINDRAPHALVSQSNDKKESNEETERGYESKK